MNEIRQYISIDLKSFFASVECVERGLDPLNTNLVVADGSRTETTICLAVSPSLKSYGISGRARLFEVVQRIKEVNAKRKRYARGNRLVGESCFDDEIKQNSNLAVSYIVAPPQMAKYVEISSVIYAIYLKYISPEDIHVYSIDEVFIDATGYLRAYKCTARELAVKMITDVMKVTGITATAGIGTNLYLSKVAMDIMAKSMPADSSGVRIAELDEATYRKQLWGHTPLTSFWRIGKGYASRLEANGMYTMGDIARKSLENEELLYKLFGVNAELLIDHAWGREPCTVADIKAYKPKAKSLSSGQVLSSPYSFDKTRIIIREMTDLLVLDLVEKHLKTDRLVLEIGYDVENINGTSKYKGEITTDSYGRKIPRHSHGTVNFGKHTSSTKLITDKTLELYDKIASKSLTVRRVNISVCNLTDESGIPDSCAAPEQIDLFTDYKASEQALIAEQAELKKERATQEVIVELRRRFGKNALLKGTSYQKDATTKERNAQIGGHKA